MDSRHQANLELNLHPSSKFNPNRLIRHGVLQSMMARRIPRDLVSPARLNPILFDAGPDHTPQARPGERVRLLGYYAASLSLTQSRGLVLLLHGWEGCSHSQYNLVMSDALLRAGYDVLMLNMRDHGPGRHVDPYLLNRGVFNGTLIEEVVSVTHQIAALAGDKPFYIVGASMGGSFALRLAIRHSEKPFHNLQRIVAICPALNPAHAVQAIDSNRLFIRFFRKQWLGSLQAKQQHFPDLYEFGPLRTLHTVGEMTAWWAPRYTGYASAQDYYSHYTIPPDGFRHLNLPIHIIASASDGVIPVGDFYQLEPHPLLDLQIHQHGGHVGFVDIFPLRHYLPRFVLPILQRG